ncbi:MAG TPA: NAD(P)/FAD-dependent oxidoreductase [Methanoregulaceae archaeon]|nr:MAG: NAD(P)/FAD-dependent oxidoreductase [Methanolinea sp.]HON80948.1 NAD(P)/FAD-dependent oxidoreductase [Methanoregulaceae archaeon]HPD09686.1 NAD(P)/FAD-dependent oxidoreductase [Methanoregulaceae archaeon]HRT15720.1 NAD(P)/FAD-dependent oxidoreductase [Methanoregulaceae archaeon]HRU31200.1 NAD(P)/FAD-dependent oxidoreductase [Methanoregulaceae archaeon]
MAHHTGAILQRDGKTFGIVTRVPGGFVTPEALENLAAVARKYRVPMVKLTSGQRFMLIGIPEKDLPSVFKELGPLAEKETAPCIKYVQGCLGTDVCKYGVQDSTALGLELEEKYHGTTFPAKLKFGVSGCPRCCGESFIRDIGLVGTTKGWTVIFGGNSGRRPSVGTVIAEDLSTDDALDLVHRLLEYYQNNASPKERTARFLERIGYERLKSELLTLLPYIPLEGLR